MKKIFIVLLFWVGFSCLSNAQNLGNLSSLKVDELSDAQIEQLIKRAESSGLSSSQLEAMAREQGLSPIEAGKLRERIEKLFKSTSGDESDPNSSSSRDSQESEMKVDPFDSLRKSDPYYDLSPIQKKIFGYKLFHNRNLDFNPSLNLPTPQNYIIGSGDKLIIDVYGASQQSFDLTVNPEGRILIPNLGPIQVGGSTIEASASRLKNSLGRIYSGLLGPNPNTFVQIRLGNIRSIKVALVGELNKPGNYTLPSFATVFNALYAAGGPNENGAFRNVQVYRNSRLVATVDIYEFLIKGEQSFNITLQDNDVIIVPPVENRIEVIGPVKREGLFEIKSNETLADLYNYTGGFLPKAFKDRVTIRRIENNARKIIDVDKDHYQSFNPKDGDEILVGEALDRFTNRVQIEGAVMRPGEYSLEEGLLTVKGLIQKAQGLKPEAFTVRATLYRTSSDLTLAAQTLDLKAIMDGVEEDVLLKNEDLLFVPSRYDIQEEFYVKISGEVNLPGTYPYASSMTIGDLILRSGGLLQSASSSSIEIARRVRDASSGKRAEIVTMTITPTLQLSDAERNTPLMPFDHVFIRRSPGFEREQLVRIQGEVVYPGDFAISSANERVSDVIRRAGGLNQFAYPKGANLIRRTIYFKDVPESELREIILKEIKSRLDPEKTRRGNEAEKLLFEKLENKISGIEEVKKEKEKEDLEKRLSQYFSMDSTFLDSTINAVRVKEQDLVGIDLEAILANPGGPDDLILQEGDIIKIPKQLQTVRMVGEVLMPTTARYVKNRGLRSYVSRAGGFTEKANKAKTYVIYANGDARRTHSFLGLKFFPNLEPGSEIVVPVRPQKPGLSPAAWLGMASSLATIGILVQTLVNNQNN